jgi:hypothetical protein
MCTPKYPTLLGIVREVVLRNKRKLLIFCQYPMVQFCVENFFKVLCFKTLGLRAGMSLGERAHTAARFNDPADDGQILVVTYATCSVGLNLHGSCSDMVMVEVAMSANTVLQAIGRIHRLGQSNEQRVWILSGTNTFDRFVEYNQAKKMIGQIIGMGHSAFADLDLSRDSCEENETESSVTAVLINRADVFLQQMLGQSSTRLNWEDNHDTGVSEEKRKTLRRMKIPTASLVTKTKRSLGVTPRKKQSLKKPISDVTTSMIQEADATDADSELSEAPSTETDPFVDEMVLSNNEQIPSVVSTPGKAGIDEYSESESNDSSHTTNEPIAKKRKHCDSEGL